MDIKNKNVTIFGLGKSGVASARKLIALGAKVFASEEKAWGALDQQAIGGLVGIGVKIEAGGHTLAAVENAELIVVSPGVHLDVAALLEAGRRGIPVISEVELAYQLLKKPIIAVTGTNGKTTVTTLIGEMLKAGGKKAAAAGNIGYPLVSVDDRGLDYIVAEISSYQMEAIREFRPWISVVLNIQEDHLERHHSLKEYMAQKARVFMNQKEDDFLIYNAEDKHVPGMVKTAVPFKIPFTKKNLNILGLPPSEIRIPGRHNLENALAAAHAANIAGIKQEIIAQVLRDFPGVEHRIEFVAEIAGVKYYNDSKATNPDSTLVALETFSGRPAILILGGRDKGVNLDAMCQKIKAEVKQVILMGEAAERFAEELRRCGFSAVLLAHSMQSAVQSCHKLAVPGDIVLLSPACASFDMFSNYEERGEVFKKEVLRLKT